MAYTSLKRKWWAKYRCTAGIPLEGGFFGRTTVWAANADIAMAYKALEQGHLGSGYTPTKGGYIGSKRRCPAGIGGRTCQSDGTNCSMHNYCIALDIEYNYNRLAPTYPNRHSFDDIFVRDANLHKYTPQQVKLIEGIKNAEGTQLFRWLGVIGDYMHWEIDVPPDKVSVDWSTVPEGVAPAQPISQGEDNLFCKYSDGFGAGNMSENVLYWQQIMHDLGIEVGDIDGKYGSDTTNAVKLAIPGNSGVKIGAKEAAAIHKLVGLQGSVVNLPELPDFSQFIKLGDRVTLR